MKTDHIGLTWSNEHPVHFELRRRWWPLFYATNAFLPRLRLTITNRGAELEEVSITVRVRRYEGTIADLGSPPDDNGWIEAASFNVEQGWGPGEKKAFSIRVNSRTITEPGTYIMDARLTEHATRTGTMLEEVTAQMRAAQQSVETMTDEQRQQMVANVLAQMTATGIDPHRPMAIRTPRKLSKMRVIDFFHVEPFSAVLNFWLVTGTLIMALGTLVLALAALLR